MDVEWRLQKQQALQGGVNIGCGFEILPANNMGDALNGIIWLDDAQICSLQVVKSYNLKPTITVEIDQHKGELNVIPARGD